MLTNEENNRVDEWIRQFIKPAKTKNTRYGAYQLKGMVERMAGFYLTKEDFRARMTLLGYEEFPRNIDCGGHPNVDYKISLKPLKAWHSYWSKQNSKPTDWLVDGQTAVSMGYVKGIYSRSGFVNKR